MTGGADLGYAEFGIKSCPVGTPTGPGDGTVAQAARPDVATNEVATAVSVPALMLVRRFLFAGCS